MRLLAVSYTHLDVYKRQLVSLLSNKNYFDKIFYVNIGNPQERNKDVLFVKEFENMSDNEKDYLRSVNFKISKSAGIIKLLFVGDNVKETYLTNEPYFLDKHHNACLLYTSRCV